MTKSAIFWIIVLGIAIGWLVGLSVSPVVGTTVTALLGIAGAVVSFFTGTSDPKKQPLGDVNPMPIALLALTIAISATAGALVREGIPIVNAGKDAKGKPLGIRLFSADANICAELDKSPNDQLAKSLEFYSANNPVFSALATSSEVAKIRKAVNSICPK